MKYKWVFFSILLVILVFSVEQECRAVDTIKIDRVRSKEILEGEDFRIIDEFVAGAIGDLLKAWDFASASKVRKVILLRATSGKDSAAGQYAEQFSESAYKYLAEGLNQAGMLEPEDQKFKVILNLLILIDELGDMSLIELALDKLDDESEVIRYRAVRAVTNAWVLNRLNQSGSGDRSELARKIVQRLGGVVDGAGPETLALVAEFAVGVNIPEGGDLLIQIADIRLKRYEQWVVEDELLETTILILLCDKLSLESSNKAAIGRRFAQLYSYVMQKYIMDVQGESPLYAESRQKLASVLVEIEKSCLGKILGMPQSVIKKAIDDGDYVTLLQEHSRLLGDRTRAGRLAEKLKFDYGKNPDGSVRISPLELPERPSAGI